MTTTLCELTEAWFAPGTLLPPHVHGRAVFAVMLDGSFKTTIGRRTLDCVPSISWVEPCEERHANRVGTAGAHVLVVQPDSSRADAFQAVASFLDDVSLVHDEGVIADTRRLVSEAHAVDSLSTVIIDSLVLLMLARAARSSQQRPFHLGVPSWLCRAQELLHENFRTSFELADVARAVDVRPSHLAHAFRRHFRTTAGEYARALRVRWAAERLVDSDDPISAIAVAAGYADQSHFTRQFKRATGFTPHAYRRLRPTRA